MLSSRRLPLFAIVSGVFLAAVSAEAQTPPMHSLPLPAQPQAQNQAVQRLTLTDVESIAIQNHPHIQAAAQLASAASAQAKEVQSLYYPQASGAATGTYAENNSRIAAGFLNSPSVFDKFAGGVAVSQLVTDFGRTHELSKSSHFHMERNRECHHHARRRVAARQCVLLCRDESPVRSESRRGNCESAPTGC